MTEKTREFLLACKEAGYERVTIFIHDERVPCSVQLRKGSTGWDTDEDGIFTSYRCEECREIGISKLDETPTSCSACSCKRIDITKKSFAPKTIGEYGYPATYWGGVGNIPFKVVCGAPERLGSHPQYPGNTWPLMWTIVKELDLNQRGSGHLDGHDIRAELCHLLTEGYYDLSELN